MAAPRNRDPIMTSYWIQNSDFSNPDGMDNANPFQSVSHILELIDNYDWAKENIYEAEQEKTGQDYCPAGIGIVKAPGVILHICPQAKDKTALIHLHYKLPQKLFGFIPTQKDVQISFNYVPWAAFENCLQSFMQSDYDRIAQALKTYRIN